MSDDREGEIQQLRDEMYRLDQERVRLVHDMVKINKRLHAISLDYVERHRRLQDLGTDDEIGF